MDGDEQVRLLARLDRRDQVTLTVAGRALEGVANSVFLGDSRIRVMVADRTSDRTYRVETRWADGWLDPRVDVCYPGSTEFQRLGTLEGIEKRDLLAA